METPIGYYVVLSLVLILVGVLAVLRHRRSLVRLLTGMQISFLGVLIFLGTVSYCRQSLKGYILSFFLLGSILTVMLVAWAFFVKFYKNAHLTFDRFND